MTGNRVGLIVSGTLAALLVVVCIAPVTAAAHRGTHPDGTVHPAEETTGSDGNKSSGQNRLEGDKLRACRIREKNIAVIMRRTVARTEKQMALFETVTGRVEEFYATKGKTVDGYDRLYTAVQTARADVSTDIEALRTAAVFDCDGDDPKGAAAGFKAVVTQASSDMTAYRQAVKNFIVGVKSAQGGNP